MKLRLFSLICALALVSTLIVAPVQTQAATPQAIAGIPVTGAFTDALGGTGLFQGTLSVTRFVNQNGQLAAVGTLTGTLTNSLGAVLGTVTQALTLPVTSTVGTCQVLNLTLGPLDLNLLGLLVHLDQVVLNINAQSGPGNLVGNLVCAVSHLLDSNASLTALTNLLNHLLGAL